MKKKILASIVLVIILAISGCGSSPNQPADNSQTSQTQESTTTTNTDTETESKTEQTSDSDTSNSDTSMNEEDSQVISGIVEDATMNTITIQTSDGQSLSFATEGAETSYKDGLIIGIPVKITYTGEIKETDTSDTKVIRIVEEN